jgi:hypothetical protein
MGEEPMMTRRRHRVADEQPLGPEDDPYVAYLLWRAQRDAEAAAADGAPADEAAPSDERANDAAPARSGVRSWLGRLSARRHVNAAGGERDRPAPEAAPGRE